MVAGRRHWYTMPQDRERFASHFRTGIPAGTPFYVTSGRRGIALAETCLLGAISTGWSLVTYNEDGADLYMLDSCAQSRGVAWIRRFERGRWINYRVGTVTIDNEFRGWHIPSLTPFFVFSYQPPAPAPAFEFPWWSDTWVDTDGIVRGERWGFDCFRHAVDSGWEAYFVVYRGGTLSHLEGCIAEYEAVSSDDLFVWTIHDRVWIAESGFADAFPGGRSGGWRGVLLLLCPRLRSGQRNLGQPASTEVTGSVRIPGLDSSAIRRPFNVKP